MIADRSYVPWRDDALLPVESAYALWSKISWFQAADPVALIRRCRSTPTGRSPVSPREIRFHDRSWPHRYLRFGHLLPVIAGRSSQNQVFRLRWLECMEVPWAWRCSSLRVCKQCLRFGIHLRIHQHWAVAQCPFHGIALDELCPHCKSEIPYGYSDGQKPFSCNECGRQLADDQVGVVPEATLGQNIVAASAVASDWLKRLCVDGSQVAEDPIVGRVDRYNATRASTLHLIMSIAAVEHAYGQRPPWMVQRRQPGTKACLTSVSMKSRLAEAFTDGYATEQSGWHQRCLIEDSSKPIAGMLDLLDELPHHRIRLAYRRVTRAFLKACRENHSICLDGPLALSLSDLPEEDRGIERLSQCCPVALGFWIWRCNVKSVVSDFVLYETLMRRHWKMAKDVWNGNLDIFLFSVVRSHLHFCIALSHHWQANRFMGNCKFPSAFWISNYVSMVMRWIEVSQGEGYFSWDGVSFRFLRVDASELISNSACPGDRPREKLAQFAIRKFSETTNTNIELAEDRYNWWWSLQRERYGTPKGSPFAWLPCDWFLFDGSPPFPLKSWLEEPLTGIWNSPFFAEPTRSYLDVAVSSRTGPNQPRSGCESAN